jgi:hypothetical protein
VGLQAQLSLSEIGYQVIELPSTVFEVAVIRCSLGLLQYLRISKGERQQKRLAILLAMQGPGYIKFDVMRCKRIRR